ncbi:MAG: divalent-cation tolerance protein CutA [bacterium]
MNFKTSDDYMILVYVTCDSVEQAESIGKEIMKKHLCACVNIFKEMQSMFFWPPKSEKIDKSKEVVLILKSLKSKFPEIEAEITKLHSYDVPCILALPVVSVSDKYLAWIKGEMAVSD